MLLAVYHKKRTGKGQYIDGSQLEPSIYLTGTAVLDFAVNGRHYQRTGNRAVARPAAPHGAYRCAGEDRWIAIAVTNEEEWRALAAHMGNPSWTADERFRTMAARVENQDELDRLLGAWTLSQEAVRVAGPTAAGRSAGRSVPDRRRSGRTRSATAPSQMADPTAPQRDWHVADKGCSVSLYQCSSRPGRTIGPCGALLWARQRLRVRRTSQDVGAGASQTTGGGNNLIQDQSAAMAWGSSGRKANCVRPSQFDVDCAR